MSTELSAIGCFRYLTGRGNICSKMHLVGKTSVRHLFGRGIINWGRVWTENCLSRFFLVRKMSIGKVLHGVIPSVICLVVKMTFEKLSVGEVTIEEVSIVGVLAGENVRPENAWTQVKPALDEKTPQKLCKTHFPFNQK